MPPEQREDHGGDQRPADQGGPEDFVAGFARDSQLPHDQREEHERRGVQARHDFEAGPGHRGFVEERVDGLTDRLPRRRVRPLMPDHSTRQQAKAQPRKVEEQIRERSTGGKRRIAAYTAASASSSPPRATFGAATDSAAKRSTWRA